MTEHLDFLEQLPIRAVLDGKLVSFGEDAKPDFERLCERMLLLALTTSNARVRSVPRERAHSTR